MDLGEESNDLSDNFEKERKKVKKRRKDYTLNEIKILNFYDKIKSIRENLEDLKFHLIYSTRLIEKEDI